MFVDRVSELKLLEEQYRSGKAGFFVLYGRRRVGKTELLNHFCEGKRAVFFVADLGSEASLRAGLSEAVNNVLFGPEQIHAVYTGWEEIFQALARGAQTKPLVVVLDEFSYLISAFPPLATILQRLWDQTLKNTQIFLILCGSYIGMMEEAILGYRAPLYGRRTGQYLLEPLGFWDTRMFLPSYSPEDQVRAYAVYGGTPAYLQTIQPDLSLAENILKGILRRGSYLYDEVRFVLQQELREPRNYFAILQAVASGKTRLNEIKLATGIEGATAYLETLQQLHLVERLVPVTETQPHKSRRGIYRLKDNYLRFWFRYVHPNWSQLEQGGGEIVLETQILPQIDAFTEMVFEEICRQYFLRPLSLTTDRGEDISPDDDRGKTHLVFNPSKVGAWWNPRAEIDVVALGESEAILGECKWSSRPVGIDILAELERKAALAAPDVEGRDIRLALCSRSGFTRQLIAAVKDRKEVMLINLPEIMEGKTGKRPLRQ